ncbi:MAG TPA: Glu-tRNA(Gln) amidotransferase subunit GatE [bacterium]|nr:Glu-tRNA(Gln) amidotransferase subunit GatE [bacterium]
MTDELQKLGFKCGVEIHQQLLTERKLFCRCPAARYSTEHHAEVLRHMRPTLSEMGVYDGCALMEFKTKKEILYLLNKESVCTYEMDDTPPFPINQQALDIAIELALMVGCSIVDEMHLARKQYLDGSIPTGFQRTGIVGINGGIPFEGKRIGISHFSIEEDACREVTDEGHLIRFRTDRLGMPLIEVVTDACFKSPEEASRGVRHIGRILRATGKVRTGIGAVRQDVNVSIEGGRRVEIKGVPRYQLIPALTRNEALRQKALLDIQRELKVRKITAENLETYEADLTEGLKNTRSPNLAKALENGHRIRGIRLGGLGGILNTPTQPGRMFSSELAGRVRVIACLDEIPNLYHTDNYPEYPRSHIDLRSIRLGLELKERDVGVIAWGPEADTITAMQEIRNRIVEALDGVPCETRQHLRDGLTDFERILPGADRMYPDTDHPPVRITPERVEKIRAGLPEPTYAVEERLTEYGLPKDTLRDLALSKRIGLIDRMAKEKRDMKLVGRLVGQATRSLARQGIDTSHIPDEALASLISACEETKLKAKFYEQALSALAADPSLDIATMVASFPDEANPSASA